MRFAHPERIADWPEPNFEDPELRGVEIYIILAIFCFMATSIVALRFYVRIFQRKWVGLDDYMLAFAYVCMLGDVGVVLWGYHRYEWDRHFWDSYNILNLKPGAQAVMAAKLFWAVAACFIRFSLLVFYYRLLNHIDELQRRTWKWVLHATTFFNIGIFLSYIFTTVFHCRDPKQYFQWPGEGYCLNEVAVNTSLAALNTFAEALMAALPIPVVFTLEMDKTQRRTVLLLLCLGFLVSVVGTVRTYYAFTLFDSNDMTWYASPYWICSEVEICVAMICACAPALRSYIGRRFWHEKVAPLTRRNTTSRLRKKRGSNGSKSSNMSTQDDGWVPPQQMYQYDLEGIGVDGFGYTVTISGPQRKRNGLTAWCHKNRDEERDVPPRWSFPRKLDGDVQSDTMELRKTPSKGEIVETHEITKTVSGRR